MKKGWVHSEYRKSSIFLSYMHSVVDVCEYMCMCAYVCVKLLLNIMHNKWTIESWSNINLFVERFVSNISLAPSCYDNFASWFEYSSHLLNVPIRFHLYNTYTFTFTCVYMYLLSYIVIYCLIYLSYIAIYCIYCNT